MKFAKYLQETQTPEWKRAYIDYRGLKKKIHTEDETQNSESTLPMESENLSEEVANDGPSTSHIRYDSGMGIGELPVRRKSTSMRRAASQTQTLPSTRLNHQSSRTSSRTKKPLNNKGFFARATPFRSPLLPSSRSVPLHELIPLLPPKGVDFINTLDEELEKVENFYGARKKEMEARTKLLEDQLKELDVHHQRFHQAQVKNDRWISVLPFSTMPRKAKIVAHDHVRSKNKGREVAASLSHGNDSLDPDEYKDAKKKLKKAVIEHYRGLEMLHNYRILNVTGFRKALKKFEKVTGIAIVQHAYMTERVETSSFASDTTLPRMMDEMEVLFGNHFTHGDNKGAKSHLRAESVTKTHHYSTFRSGLLLGAAIPALVSGIVFSYQAETRSSIPGWDGLLFVYSVLLIPVVFSLLVGINLMVWSYARINYVFIFELDPRTRLNHREYFEIPSLLFTTLCYAFWLSFARIGAPSITPYIWPLVWLGFTAVVMFDPLNFSHKSSRFWLMKSILKLLASGTRPVEFADFWMGDQFCSLIFTLSDLFLFACSYSRDFNNWRQCGSTSNAWPVAFTLATLPFLIRVIQSIKRYVDSRLNTHLINGGKYVFGIIYYLSFYIWRHQGQLRNTSFVIWCLFGTIYSLYASAWDFWMDWSILRPHVKYTFLRAELLYTDYIPAYYFAIISNILIRFIWVIFIPSGSTPDTYLRLFIAGFLEILRRWQWNFFRLENEHLGNMDQYRVTREVPLPYSFDRRDQDDTDTE